MKKILRMLILVIVFPVVLGSWHGAVAAEKIPVLVNKESVLETVYLTGKLVDNTTFVMAREFSEAVGLSPKWYGETASVVWDAYGGSVVVTDGLDTSFVVQKDIKEVKWTAAPFSREGRIFVPLRTLEPLGFTVSFDSMAGVRTIDVPKQYKTANRPGDKAIQLVKGKIISEISKKPKKIGSYSTIFNPEYGSRTTNLKLAAQAVNGAKILPGGVFSYNKEVGPRTPKRGYQKAIIFVNKEKVEDYGGGVCQVSSTLYNAVLGAGLPVLERHPHSLPVTYVPQGKDATVNYGTADFRFKNSTDGTISIRALVEKNILTVELFLNPEE